jgi:hypothetical protein
MKKGDFRETWKPLDLEGFEGRYLISSKGVLKRNSYSFWRKGNRGTVYQVTKEAGLIIKWNCSKTCSLLKAVLHRTTTDENGETISVLKKTVYQHRLVALHFVKGKSKARCKVTHKDTTDPTHNWADNLKWVSTSYLSRRNMEKYPELRNNLRNANIKNGYYTKIKSRPLIKSLRYFQFTVNRIFNNRIGEVARLNQIKSLAPVQTKYKDKISDSRRFIFSNLTKEECVDIQNMLPTHLTSKGRTKLLRQ